MDTMMIAAGAGGEGLRILDMIFTIFTFLVLLALLKKFAWGRLRVISYAISEETSSTSSRNCFVPVSTLRIIVILC